MKVKKTHVKSAKRQARIKDAAEAAKKAGKKSKSSFKKPVVAETSFRFKSQAERYKDISIDLQSLLQDAAERYGRYDVQEKPEAEVQASEDEDEQMDYGDEEQSVLATPMSTALAELVLLNTSLPFQALHKTLYPLTRSLPLILHNRTEIANALVSTLNNANRVELAYSAAHTIDLIPAYIQSLWPDPDFGLLEFDTILTPLMRSLVRLALDAPSAHANATGDKGNDSTSGAEISKRAFQVMAWTFREIGGDLVNKGDLDARSRIAWSWVEEGLGGEVPELQSVPANINEPEMADAVAAGAELEEQDEEDGALDAGEALTAINSEAPEDSGTGDAENSSDSDIESEAEGMTAETDEKHRQTNKRRRPTSSTKPHLRRLLATCFSFLVRKAKTGKPLETLTGVVLASLSESSLATTNDLSEAVAWIIVESIKSVETLIHSRGPAIFKAFTNHALSQRSDKASQILQSSLTAILHHSRVEAIKPIVDSLLAQFTDVIESKDSYRMVLLCGLIGVLAGTRKGSRLTNDAKVDLMTACDSLLDSVAAEASAGSPVLRVATETATKVLLIAPGLDTMISKGRKLLERIWALRDTHFSLASASFSTLSSQRWIYFTDFAAPLVCSSHVPASKPQYVTLLARLADDGHLPRANAAAGDLLSGLQMRLQAWLVSRKNGKVTERQTLELYESLKLAASLQVTVAIRNDLLSAITTLTSLPAQDTRHEYQQTCLNSAIILTAVLNLLGSAEGAEELSGDTVNSVTEKYGWHRSVLQALVNALPEDAVVGLSLEELYPHLRSNITSGDSHLRSSTVSILCKASPSSTILRKCLQTEEVAMTAQSAREKTLHLRRLGVLLKSSDPASLEFAIGVTYCVSMLQVNFKPLWSESMEALAEASGGAPASAQQQIWNVMTDQIERAAAGRMEGFRTQEPHWTVPQGLSEEQESDPLRRGEFRCTSNMRISQSFDRSLQDIELDKTSDASISAMQVSQDHLAIPNYETQLLLLCGRLATLAEQHSRDLLSIFFEHFDRTTLDDSDASGGKLGRQRLAAWLSVFSKFKNPKALYRSEDFYGYLLLTLSHGDVTLQRLSLDCILTWKSPNLLPYEEHFRKLLDETSFRDELLHFSLAEEENTILPSRRPEVVPVIIRILFGLMSSRQGRASAVHVQAGRKTAILGALRICSPQELDTLLDLMLAPFKLDSATAQENAPSRAVTARQVGFLTLLSDILKHLGSKVQHRWNDLTSTVIDIATHSQPTTVGDHATSSLRRVRQLALRRLADFFTYDPAFDFTKFLPSIFESLVSPRLQSFAAENAQAPSALMDLFGCWASNPAQLDLLVDYDSGILPALYDCLSVTNVKRGVIAKVLDIARKTLGFAHEDDHPGLRAKLVQPYLQGLLRNLAYLLSKTAASLNARDTVGVQQIALLTELAPFVDSPSVASQFQPLLLLLLGKPNRTFPENLKTDVLRILHPLLPLAFGSSTISVESPEFLPVFETISSLFAILQSRPARTEAVAVFNEFSHIVPSLQTTATLVSDLNAYSARRLEEPDFDKRLAAFAQLQASEYLHLKAKQWIPIIHNMFFFVQDPEELSIRTNASSSLRRFVEVAGSSLDSDMRQVFTKVLIPGLKAGVKSKMEVTRVEVVSVMATAVDSSTGVAEFEEMKCLLFGGDQEASFFSNIHHVQVHRRIRAMRRLAEEADEGHLSSKTIADILLPLLGHNVTSSAEKKNVEVINETVQCIGRLAKQLQWSAYNRLLQQYLKYALEERAGQKVFIRTAVNILKGFHFDLIDAGNSVILANVSNRLLPRLMQFLEKREESEETMRIPMAEGIASVIQKLPEDSKMADVSSLITALAQVLRSKSQETRDLTRATILNISILLGPSYLATTVRDLRGALTRGPQLHVLAYTVHVLLVRMTGADLAGIQAGIDGCLGDVMPILFDDIFGQPSKDRESQEFRSKTKIREVRQSKSLDSLELIAKVISPDNISKLLGPVRDRIGSTESAKTMRDVDDVLRHVATGLQANADLDVTRLLVLCQALISQNTEFLKPRKQRQKGQTKQASADYHVQLKRNKTQDHGDTYAHNAHRFVSFGLDLLNGAFRRNKFDIHDNVTVSRLDPLIGLVGNTLYAEEDHILERSLRAVSALIRCPLSSLDRSAPVLVKQIISVLEHTGGTSSELAQTCIRTLAIIIRDRKSVTLQEEQTTTLINLISPDIEETDQQAAIFSLLRSIISRTIIAPEIYDLLDRVAEILVTNQSAGTREICRSIYLQFLLDYPQGKKRLGVSMEFLAKNLGGYAHESGRTSVLELVNAILSKFGQNLIDQYSNLYFMALTMDIANDQSSRCREMSAENLKVLLSRVGPSIKASFLQMLLGWSAPDQPDALVRTAVQVLGLLVESTTDKGEVQRLTKQLLPVLIDVAAKAALGTEDDEDEATAFGTNADPGWQTPYQALQTLSKITRALPNSTELVTSDARRHIRSLLLYPHGWVRNASARLLSVLSATAKDDIDVAELIDAASKSTTQLRSKLLDDTLAMQIVKNMYHIAKRFAATATASNDGNLDIAVKDVGEINYQDDDLEDTAGDSAPELRQDTLHWLFVKLSHRARVAHQSRPSLYSTESREFKWSLEPASILRIFAAIISEPSVTVSQVQAQVLQILTPIVRIVDDPNGAKDPQLDELQTLAREVQEVLTEKIGTTPVTETYNEVRRKLLMRREERKRTSALAALSNPEQDAKRRAKRTENKAKAKKRKNQSFSETKARYGMKGGAKKPRRE